jgi:hypothetical protein
MPTTPFELEQLFEFNAREPLFRWFRVEGKCMGSSPSGDDDGDDGDPGEGATCDTTSINTDSTCPQFFITNVLASSVSDLCRQLKDNEFVWPIENVKVWSRPALRRQREELEARGEDFSCNELTEVPFESLSECLEFALDFDLVTTAGISTDIPLGTGGTIEITGDASLTSGSGTIVISGSAGVKTDDDFGLFTVAGGITTTFEIVDAILGETEGEQLFPDFTLISTRCDCEPLPLILELTQGLNRDNKLQKFLDRNGLSFPRTQNIRYSALHDAWQSATQFTGLGEDTVSQERWSIVFEWACVNELGGVTYDDSTFWKFCVFIDRKNLTTGQDFDTRILLTFIPDGVCSDQFGLDFEFQIDTQTQISEILTQFVTSTEAQLHVFFDSIGLFTSKSWQDNPNLVFKVTRLETEQFPGRLNIQPIIPPVEEPTVAEGLTPQAFVPPTP